MADQLGADHSQVELAPSCRLDWLSLSYAPKTPGDMEEVLGYFFSVARAFAEGSSFREGGGRRFFAESLVNDDAGVLLRWTPHNGGINAGKVSIDLQGSFFSLTDAQDRKAVYLDSVELPGWSKCTRADTQRTVIDPIRDSEAIYSLVRDREVWISGYNSFSQLASLDSKGDAIDGASTVWGKPTAAVRCLTYNKALEQKRPDLDVVRHEVRCRKEAAHGYFCDLVQSLRKEPRTDPTYAEQLICRSVLSKHMTYLDTSRLAHIRDKSEWPKNWKQHSKPASFMAEIVDGEVQDVKRAYRVQKRLEERKAAADRQYGPTQAQWVLFQMWRKGKDRALVLDEMFDQWVVRLRDEHREDLRKAFGDVVPDNFDELFDDFVATAAHNVEGHQ